MKMNKYGHAWSNTIETNKRLRLEIKERFMYFHNPRNWELAEFKDGKKTYHLLLPVLNQMILEAGVNGVRSFGKSIDYNLAITNLQQDGCTVLDPSKIDYMVAYDVIGGKHYTDKFTIVEEIAGNVILSYNHEAFNDFRRKLIVDGIIDLPHDHFVRLILRRNNSLLNRLSGQLHNPSSKARYEKAELYSKQVKQASDLIKKQGVKAYEQRRQNTKDN